MVVAAAAAAAAAAADDDVDCASDGVMVDGATADGKVTGEQVGIEQGTAVESGGAATDDDKSMEGEAEAELADDGEDDEDDGESTAGKPV